MDEFFHEKDFIEKEDGNHPENCSTTKKISH